MKQLIPEITLFITVMGLILGEIAYLKERIRLATPIALIGLGVATINLVPLFGSGVEPLFGGGIVIDPLAVMMKALVLLISMISVVSIHYSKELAQKRKTEAHALVLGLALFAFVIVSANHLLVAFTASAVFWCLSAVLSGFNVNDTKSNEAALKTVLMGLASVFFFFVAIALVSNLFGSFLISELHKAAYAQGWAEVISFWLFMIAFAIQIGIFPFHQLFPDMTEGAPTPVSGVLNVMMRIAAFGLAMRIWMGVFRTQGGELLFPWDSWTQIISAVTLLVGGFLAFGQETSKRLIGALLLVESGFLILGFSAMNPEIFGAALFSLFTQSFASLGVFLVLGLLIDQTGSDRINDLKSAFGKDPFNSVALIILVAAAAGVPPFPSFLARFALIASVVGAGHTLLGSIAILGMSLSWMAVARLVAPMVSSALESIRQGERNKLSNSVSEEKSSRYVVVAIVFVLLVVTVFSNRVIGWAVHSIQPIF